MAITYEAVAANEYVSHIDVEQLGNQTLYSVVSGCAVSESASNMVVTIASGTVLVNGTSTAVAGGTITLVADPSNKRWNYATVDSSGNAQVVLGDPAASGSVEPTKPDPSGKVILKMYKVEAGQTIAANIAVAPNKRVLAFQNAGNVLTTKGDLLVASAANTMARLAASTDGLVLTATGAGQLPAWEAIPAGGPTRIYKTTAETVNNSATYQDDDDWNSISLDASSSYAYKIMWTFSGQNSAGFKLKTVYSDSSTTDYQIGSIFRNTSASNDNNVYYNGFYDNGGSVYNEWKMIPIADTYIQSMTINGIINTDSSGTVKVQWAQNSAVASATTILAGSYFEYQKAS